MVSANHWLSGIKTYRLSWCLTWVSANHASSNSAQAARSRFPHRNLAHHQGVAEDFTFPLLFVASHLLLRDNQGSMKADQVSTPRRFMPTNTAIQGFIKYKIFKIFN